MRIYSTTGSRSRKAQAALRAIENRRTVQDPLIERQVRRILNAVRTQGDTAVRRYAERFDKLDPHSPLPVSDQDLAAAWQAITPDQRNALKLAAKRVRAYAIRQLPREWQRRDRSGMTLGQIVRPLESVACYVPAGRHPLPSTLLMTVVPALVAGVPRIVILCPRPSDMVLAAANLLRVPVLRIGGAQAIAAAAYGTDTIPRFDRIVGPGNAFVTAAKQIIADDSSTACSIDMAAGPTETLIASNTGSPQAIAADLVAQAEHDPQTLCIFLTTNPQLAAIVEKEATRQAAQNSIASASLRSNGAVFVLSSVEEMFDAVNRIAPEHLTVDTLADLPRIRNAGSVFIGTQTPQALGDYVSGPNHTLPTAGAARQRGGLSVTDFVKIISIQSASRAAIATLAPHANLLAQSEGLLAHAASLQLALDRTRA